METEKSSVTDFINENNINTDEGAILNDNTNAENVNNEEFKLDPLLNELSEELARVQGDMESAYTNLSRITGKESFGNYAKYMKSLTAIKTIFMRNGINDPADLFRRLNQVGAASGLPSQIAGPISMNNFVYNLLNEIVWGNTKDRKKSILRLTQDAAGIAVDTFGLGYSIFAAKMDPSLKGETFAERFLERYMTVSDTTITTRSYDLENAVVRNLDIDPDVELTSYKPIADDGISNKPIDADIPNKPVDVDIPNVGRGSITSRQLRTQLNKLNNAFGEVMGYGSYDFNLARENYNAAVDPDTGITGTSYKPTGDVDVPNSGSKPSLGSNTSEVYNPGSRFGSINNAANTGLNALGVGLSAYGLGFSLYDIITAGQEGKINARHITNVIGNTLGLLANCLAFAGPIGAIAGAIIGGVGAVVSSAGQIASLPSDASSLQKFTASMAIMVSSIPLMPDVPSIIKAMKLEELKHSANNDIDRDTYSTLHKISALNATPIINTFSPGYTLKLQKDLFEKLTNDYKTEPDFFKHLFESRVIEQVGKYADEVIKEMGANAFTYETYQTPGTVGNIVEGNNYNTTLYRQTHVNGETHTNAIGYHFKEEGNKKREIRLDVGEKGTGKIDSFYHEDISKTMADKIAKDLNGTKINQNYVDMGNTRNYLVTKLMNFINQEIQLNGGDDIVEFKETLRAKDAKNIYAKVDGGEGHDGANLGNITEKNHQLYKGDFYSGSNKLDVRHVGSVNNSTIVTLSNFEEIYLPSTKYAHNIINHIQEDSSSDKPKTIRLIAPKAGKNEINFTDVTKSRLEFIGSVYENIVNGTNNDDYMSGNGLSTSEENEKINVVMDNLKPLIHNRIDTSYDFLNDRSFKQAVISLGLNSNEKIGSTFHGMEGNDILIGGIGTDKLYGDDGNDYLDGGLLGRDELYGGKGNDTLKINYMTKVIDGGEGTDIVDFSNIDEDIKLNFNSGERYSVGRRFMDNLKSIEGVKGGTGNDTFTGYLNSENMIEGNEGNDEIIGGNKNDFLAGGKGNDALYGNDGDDILNGKEGRNNLYGGAGKDILMDNHLNTTVDGGEGIDCVDYSRYDGSVSVDLQNQKVEFFESNTDTSIGNHNITSIEQVKGSKNNDTINGFETSGNSIFGYKGNDSIIGGSEADLLNGGEGDDELNGQDGNDNLVGGNGFDQIYGGDGNDLIIGGKSKDQIYGGSGDDLIFSDDMNSYNTPDEDRFVASYINGEDGNDSIYGSDYQDRIYGGSGDDYIDGRKGFNELYGEEGNDTIYAIEGHSNVHAGDGDDIVYDYSGNRGVYDGIIINVSGGNGYDRVDYSKSDLNVNIDLKFGTAEFGDGSKHNVLGFESVIGSNLSDSIKGNYADNHLEGKDGDDSIYGYEGNDRIHGDEGNDNIVGGEGNDMLFGENGDDTLVGNEGNDMITAGEGDDTLVGSEGNDMLFGGNGTDTYKFEGSFGNDMIYDPGDGNDIISFEDKRKEDIFFERENDNLIIKVIGESNSITVNNWYSEKDCKLDIKYADGSSITKNKIDLLVDQMAGFESERGVSWEDAMKENIQNNNNVLASSNGAAAYNILNNSF
ncbi:calcium-binding protein [Tepidibacter sp. Z1-5]|uniref:calcium-binding protein n=1 Tax=Tepidibacter sp. Z1-5 TaxID=3134138 RepID=UPI0030C1D420